MESLDISVTVSGTYWDKRPQYTIWLNDTLIVNSEISSELPQTHKFTHQVNDGVHQLKIRLENKTPKDTIVNNNIIEHDMMLNIVNITIDDISLDQLLHSAVYKLDEPQEFEGKMVEYLDNCINLGWNGTYILSFNSPYYLWLLESI